MDWLMQTETIVCFKETFKTFVKLQNLHSSQKTGCLLVVLLAFWYILPYEHLIYYKSMFTLKFHTV